MQTCPGEVPPAPHTPFGPAPSRRTVTRALAWSGPVVAVAAVAPAYAASTDPWRISSASTEVLSGWYRLRFTIFVPAGATVVAPTAYIQLTGNGGDMDCDSSTGVGPNTGVAPDLWSVRGSQHRIAEEFRRHDFVYLAGNFSGGQSGRTYTLYSDITLVHSADIDAASSFVFQSSSVTGPTTTFKVLADNVDGYITDPHV